jgi:CHAT domain-containing protein
MLTLALFPQIEKPCIQNPESKAVSFPTIFSELDLTKCECVTLGACESGLGRSIVTAEYMGLPLAFFAAGVRYVIGSLWKVNQLAAAILLSCHCELLPDGQHTVPSALNEAQKAIMQMPRSQVLAWVRANLPDRAERWAPVIERMKDPPYMQPYYWAGFYVAGDV